MLRMFAKRMFQVTIAPGTDTVLFGLSLPSGSVLNNVRCTVSLYGGSVQPMATALAYACEGYILPVLDPDAAVGYDVLFDTLVPKDTDAQTMDLDVGAADTTPFWEPGEADWSTLFDVGLRPELIYRRKRLLTPLNGSAAMHRDPETPFLPEWVPGELFNINIRKRYRIEQPSVVVFAVAQPNLDDTTTTLEGALGESKWGQIKYAGDLLRRALLHVFGLVETGAETPWEEATALLQEHLQPDVYEKTGGFFSAGITMQGVGMAMIDHSVEGTLEVGQIGLG